MSMQQRLYPSRITVYLPDGRVAGYIESGTWKRAIHGSRHILRKPVPAIAVCERTYRKYRPYCTELVFHDCETGRIYAISAAVFERRSFPIDRGRGRQLACPLRFWQVRTPNAPPSGQLAFDL